MQDTWWDTEDVQREAATLRLLTGWSPSHARNVVLRAAREYAVTVFVATRVLQALAHDGSLPPWTAEPPVAAREATPPATNRYYQRLADHLAAQPPEVRQVTLTHTEIAAILGVPLRNCARSPDWWTDAHAGTRTRPWHQAGWRVAKSPRSVTASHVTFERAPAA